MTGYCPAYRAAGINTADTRAALSGERGVHIRESITIGAPPETIYRFWRQLDQLPEVMPHLAKVEQLDTKRSRWTAKAFDQLPITWEAEIINEQPFETIAWQTLPGQSISTAGSVTFTPVAGGTEVRVHLQYAAPGGKAASWLASLAGQDPVKYTRDALAALKRRLEVPPPAGRSINQGEPPMAENRLREALVDEIRDLYNAEKQLTKALPKTAKAPTNDQLREAFESHLEETENQIVRLERVFELLDEKPRGKHCAGMAGIIEEGNEKLQEDMEDSVMDACIIKGAQSAEHYEIGSYGTAIA